MSDTTPDTLNREALILTMFDRIRELDPQATSSRDECITLLQEIVVAIDTPARQQR